MRKRSLLAGALILLIAATSAQADQADRPARLNIVLAIADDQSFPHAGAYGDAVVRTPAFDRVAASGVLFTQAIAPSPGCSPCRAALLTGRYPWQLEAAGTHASDFSTRYIVYPDLLEQAGYFVGYTGKGWGPGNWKRSGRTRNPAGNEFNQLRLDAPPGISRTDYTANFQRFLAARPADQPFCFWYGGHEPHRSYARDPAAATDRDAAAVEVPPFLPDADTVRQDMLDYYREIEWFDRHLGQMLDLLEELGELDRTVVIVTSDNGMPFPRAKANCYEYGIHMPLAIRWPRSLGPARTVNDLVSLVDLAPTILDAAGVEHPSREQDVPPMIGRSLRPLLESHELDTSEAPRQAVFSSRERHSSSRYQNWGYPQRALRTNDYLLVRNFHPERWPAGDPRKYDRPDQLGPPHGAYHDIDASPTLEFLIAGRDDPQITPYFHLAVARRPEWELYDISTDPGCLINLAEADSHAETIESLSRTLAEFLKATGDPRVGPQPDIFETYPRHSRIRTFPRPDEP